MRVMIDLVVNHTSDQHPWFRAAREDRDSPYRDWYVWPTKRRRTADEGMVFPGDQKTTWTFDQARRWYFHRFYDFQPDLNIANPACGRDPKIMGFWLQLGVAGLPGGRGAVPDREGANGRRHSMDFDLLTNSASCSMAAPATRCCWARRTCRPTDDLEYFGAAANGLHMLFDFLLNQHLFSRSPGTRAAHRKALARPRLAPGRRSGRRFLRNHDELDLCRLTRRPAPGGVRRVRPEPEMRLYGRGIRRRLAPMLGDRRRIELRTPCSSPCPARRSFATARRSAWATTSPPRPRRDPHADAVVSLPNAGFS